jgi:cob(I)alamin adenosyltransferase
LLDISVVLDWIRQTDPKIRLVLTGRNMPQSLIDIADEATECVMVKHPIQRGIFGRWGVEY